MLNMWEGVVGAEILEGEAITPAVLGADFLSPFLSGGGAGGATLCKYENLSTCC